MHPVTLHIAGCDAPIEVGLQPTARDGGTMIAARMGDRSVAAEIIETGDGAGRIMLGDRAVPFRVMRNGSTIDLWIGGRTYRIDASAGRATSDRAAAIASGVVTAPMPGTVQRVFVKPGDTVAVHQPLLVMISMKMELTLAASRPGRVSAVECEEGRLVEMGQMLVRIGEDGDAD